MCLSSMPVLAYEGILGSTLASERSAGISLPAYPCPGQTQSDPLYC